MLTAPNLLEHFDDTKQLILAYYASPYGVGAVLSHINADKSERPVAYASCSLSAAECKYSQLDRETLAIMFGVSKFHQYLYGRHFLIYSDHKPLMHIFSEAKSAPAMVSARLQRWALTLSAYQYSIKYQEGDLMGNADALSRLPLPECPENVPSPPETIALMEQLTTMPMSATQIRTMTNHNPILAKVKQFTLHGWPSTLPSNLSDLQPY